jgi:phosphonate transport system substrate-binding protein
MRFPTLALLALFVWLLAGCEPAPAPAGPQYANSPTSNKTYYLAVHPLYNPHKLAEAYEPLIARLNAEIPGAHFQLEASRDYQVYETKFRARQPEFLLPNPWQTLEAIKVGYAVIAMAGDAEDFKGLWIVRRDGIIHTPRDLVGKIVSYPSPTALAAAMLPQMYLQEHGVEVMRDLHNEYVGSKESSIMSVYRGDADAGATWPPPWRSFQQTHPSEAATLQVIWETPHLLNNSVMVRDDVPPSIRDKVRDVLIELKTAPGGTNILAASQTARFHPATNASSQPVAEFVQRFERTVRPVENK